MGASRIFFVAGFAHIAGSRAGADDIGDALAGIAGEVRQTPEDRAVDLSDMAVRVSNGRADLLHAVSLVPIADSFNGRRAIPEFVTAISRDDAGGRG